MTPRHAAAAVDWQRVSSTMPGRDWVDMTRCADYAVRDVAGGNSDMAGYWARAACHLAILAYEIEIARIETAWPDDDRRAELRAMVVGGAL